MNGDGRAGAASRQSVVWVLLGIAVLVIGVCILAAGNSLGAT